MMLGVAFDRTSARAQGLMTADLHLSRPSSEFQVAITFLRNLSNQVGGPVVYPLLPLAQEKSTIVRIQWLFITGIVALFLAGCSLENKSEASWKLYKDSQISSELFLMLDMKYFGKEIQQEECQRLQKFYSRINRDRTFYCKWNDSAASALAARY